MFKNAGQYAKTLSALLVYLAGAVPVLMTMHSWQEMVAYAVPGLLSVFGVYMVPNAAPVPEVTPVAENK